MNTVHSSWLFCRHGISHAEVVQDSPRRSNDGDVKGCWSVGRSEGCTRFGELIGQGHSHGWESGNRHLPHFVCISGTSKRKSVHSEKCATCEAARWGWLHCETGSFGPEVGEGAPQGARGQRL